MTKLFGTAGIRGIVGKKVTIRLVSDISYALAKTYHDVGIVVGHDARTTSESLAKMVCSIMNLAGCTVFNVGLCSFPAIANLTLESEHPLAIFITASHNPPEYNGIKILYNGREFTEKEQNQLEEIIKNKNMQIKYAKWDEIEEIKEIGDVNNKYIQRLKQTISIEGDKRKIIVDCANGPMSLLVPEFLSKVGFEVISLNAHVDGHFPGRLAEPTPENLKVLRKLCEKEKAMGVAFDGDGDRIALVDEEGKFVELSRVNALLAELTLKEEGAGIVLVSIDTSTVIDRHVANKGGRVIRYKLGKLHQKAEELILAREKVIFAAEPWKPIFPKWGLWIDGFFGLVKILNELVKTKKELREIMKEIPEHYSEREAYYVDEKKLKIIYEECKEIMQKELEKEEKKILKIDGLRIDLSDNAWMLIRKSGTEPKIRVYYEAATKERFEHMRRIAEKIAKKVDEHNVRKS